MCRTANGTCMVHHTSTESPEAFLQGGEDIDLTCSSLVHHPTPELCADRNETGMFPECFQRGEEPKLLKSHSTEQVHRATNGTQWTSAELRGVRHIPWENEGGLRNTACISSKRGYPLLVCLLIKHIKIQFLLPPGFSYCFFYIDCGYHISLGAPVLGSPQKGN